MKSKHEAKAEPVATRPEPVTYRDVYRERFGEFPIPANLLRIAGLIREAHNARLDELCGELQIIAEELESRKQK